jgi:TonB-dependent starch-binding outer membrane protein SusC
MFSKIEHMKNHLRYLLIFLAVFFRPATMPGQTITGVVTDITSGETLPSANIIAEGTMKGTVTDMDGNYTLDLSPGEHVVSFSYVGYTREEVRISLSQGEVLTMNVALNPDVTTFDELIVVGYGSQKKKVVTGAIASVDADEITSTPVLRIEQAMQGRTAGVLVTNLSGQPGESPTVRIRGAGTTGNANPLYIVDGMAVGGIDYLNPGDIESIDVLKDAASAAIYGARAANGVVLITTKRGTAGQMNVSYSAYQGVQNVSRTIEMLDASQYKIFMNEGARNAGLTEPFDLNEIPRFNTNWQDVLFQSNAPIFNHDLSVNGGTENSTYVSSLSYFSQQGIIGGDKSQFDRITARLNTRHKVNSAFTFGNNLAYSHVIRRGISSNTSFNGAYSSALNIDPLTPVYEESEAILSQPPFSSEPVISNGAGKFYAISDYVRAEIVNPLALLEIQNGGSRVDKIVGNVFGEVEIADGLRFNSSIGIDLAYVLNDSHRPLFYLNSAQLNIGKTSVTKSIDRYFTWQVENTLSYTRQINDHNFSILGGMTASKFNFEDLSGFNADVPVDNPRHVYLNLATDTVWTAYGGAAHSSLLSGFGRILYDYKSRYSLNLTIRRDGSSKFGANNRFGTFPSMGVSWIMSEEQFFPNLRNLSILKLRASWGINGNQEIGNYQFISTINKSRGYIFSGGRSFGASPSFIENADIRWEESEQVDIAVDIGAFSNRLTATADYYIKTTKGLLERIPIPAHVGNDPPLANVGSVENRGVEMSLNWRNYKEEFGYSVGLNGAYNRNRMTRIGNDEGVIAGDGYWSVAGLVTRTELGLPIAYFWGYKTDGIFQNQAEVFQHINSSGVPLQANAKPGDVRFVDVNGDGVISPDDRTMIGNPTPAFTFGMNASIDYKQFDIGLLLTGTYGNDIFNGMQRNDLRYTNRPVSALSRWTGEGTSNTTPRYTWVDANNNYRVSDLYIEDGSHLRIKNVQVGYAIPGQVLSRINASSWRVYISAENLYTLTRYSGADPEIGALSSFNIGIDRGIYPQARTLRFGTTISF